MLPFRVAVGGAVGGLVGGNGQEREDQESGDDPAKEQVLGHEVDGHQGGEKDEADGSRDGSRAGGSGQLGDVLGGHLPDVAAPGCPLPRALRILASTHTAGSSAPAPTRVIALV